MDAAGERSVSVGVNLGIIQTGDRARAFLGPPVPLGRPQEALAPVPALVGLPRRPVRTFVGRERELAALSGATVTVHGLGGVGKSELALQFAYARRDRYSLIWWVTADEPAAIESGLAELTYRLHPDGRIVATDREAAGWAMTWLQTHPGWLLVLDNVERRADVEPLLGGLTAGSIIVTTRRDVGWDEITDETLRLDVLSPPAAADLLLTLGRPEDAVLSPPAAVDPWPTPGRPEDAALSPAAAADPSPTPGRPEDAVVAEVLAAELGYLPLALRQAGAYLRETRTGLATYLADLRTDPAGTLEAVAAGDAAERAVARVWSMTLTRITELEPLAIRLLAVLSCLAPDDLPRDVLHHLGEARPRVDRALGVLASYHMITLTGTTVAVHRLVQSVVAAGQRDDRPETLRAAMRALTETRPGGDASVRPETWPRWATLSPHINALARACPDDVGGADLAALLGEHALFDQSQGRYRAKFEAEARALRIEEAEFGPDHPFVAVRLNNLANTVVALGYPADAEPLQRRSLAITERAFGPDHPDVAIRLNNLALTLIDLGRPAEAEPLQRRALAVTESTLGAGHPAVATRLGNLAITLTELGRPAEAELLQRRALSTTENALGPDHPNVALRLTNLASCLDALDRPADSEPLLRRAVRIMEATYGPEHPHVAITMGSLGIVLLRLNRPEEAEPLLRTALATGEAAFGPDHPETATGLANLAAALEALGRPAEAVPLQQRALAILEARHGANHPAVGRLVSNLALTLATMQRFAEAEALQRRALAIAEATRDPAHPEISRRLLHLAAIVDRQGRRAEAEELVRRLRTPKAGGSGLNADE
ncbi:tetratricopeptide repeat protein [Paractinoplanes rhizophilus]|uniref:Tetratricopeptide repeat protein n=1 Tax=Paractinoplanes rhizophilus TaxID=1416877 RepID=A0ABW2HM86_9ACTN